MNEVMFSDLFEEAFAGLTWSFDENSAEISKGDQESNQVIVFLTGNQMLGILVGMI